MTGEHDSGDIRWSQRYSSVPKATSILRAHHQPPRQSRGIGSVSRRNHLVDVAWQALCSRRSGNKVGVGRAHDSGGGSGYGYMCGPPNFHLECSRWSFNPVAFAFSQSAVNLDHKGVEKWIQPLAAVGAHSHGVRTCRLTPQRTGKQICGGAQGWL